MSTKPDFLKVAPSRFSLDKAGVNQGLGGLERMVLVFSGACLSSREERVVLYELTRSDKLVGG